MSTSDNGLAFVDLGDGVRRLRRRAIAVEFSPDDRHLLVQWERGPDERAELRESLTCVDLADGREVARWTSPDPLRAFAWIDADVVCTVRDLNAHDLYAATIRRADGVDLGLCELAGFAGSPLSITRSDDGRRALFSSRAWTRPDHTPGPRTAVLVNVPDLDTPRRIDPQNLLIPVPDRAARRATIRLAPSGRELLVFFDGGPSGPGYMATFDLESRRGRRLSGELLDRSWGDAPRYDALFLDDRRLIAWTGPPRPISTPVSQLLVVDRESGAPVPMASFERHARYSWIAALNVSPDRTRALVSCQALTPHSVVRAVLLDLRDGAERVLVESPSVDAWVASACWLDDARVATLTGHDEVTLKVGDAADVASHRTALRIAGIGPAATLRQSPTGRWVSVVGGGADGFEYALVERAALG